MRSPEDRIADLLSAVSDAELIVENGHTRFVGDPIAIRAAKNIISEIGEAAKDIPDEILAQLPGVPWKNVKGMRDKVVHDYPDIDIDLLWDTLVHGLPAVRTAIKGRGA